MVGFGQLILGPPGSGKSTYCGTLLDLLRAMGRPAVVINLDPANESPPYAPAVDVQDLISAADAMEAFGLGPNGALLYCMEFLQANMDWLEAQLAPHIAAGAYLILDVPGQAELYTSHDSLAAVLARLTRALDLRLVALHLVDTHHCADPAKFISGALLALQAMVRLELPHINVLSKADQTQHFEGARALFRLLLLHFPWFYHPPLTLLSHKHTQHKPKHRQRTVWTLSLTCLTCAICCPWAMRRRRGRRRRDGGGARRREGRAQLPRALSPRRAGVCKCRARRCVTWPHAPRPF